MVYVQVSHVLEGFRDLGYGFNCFAYVMTLIGALKLSYYRGLNNYQYYFRGFLRLQCRGPENLVLSIMKAPTVSL